MKKAKSTQAPPVDDEAIISLLRERPRRLKSLASALQIPGNRVKYLSNILAAMERKGQIRKLPGERFGLTLPGNIVTGRINILPTGAGKVEPHGKASSPIHIPFTHVRDAWDGDLVRVKLLPGQGNPTGKVLEILERTDRQQFGLLVTKSNRAAKFRHINGNNYFQVPLAQVNATGVHRGDLVLLQPLKAISAKYEGLSLWQADLVANFGSYRSVFAQEVIVKHSRHVPTQFPELALAQAGALSTTVQENDMADREDLRQLPFVTIDGANAKDFDDAIQVTETDNGFLLRVAIADVSHYVLPDATPGSLDHEARFRANSWYFPRSVEPMLPEVLANGLCSLRPGQDRLVLLVELPFSHTGEPQPPRFAKAVIRSAGRLLYEDVAAFFEGSAPVWNNDQISATLKTAKSLYELLAERRRERGTLDFIVPEPFYKFDENGKLVAMEDAPRNDAHKLIEEFMIAANEAVATSLGDKGVNFLYRVHPAPEPDKLERLFETLRLTALETLPPNLQHEGSDIKALRTILAKAHGTPQEYLVNRLCLRSMGQARYSTENIGHFGLASTAYCHFTSPIRRYADLQVHRALKASLAGDAAALPSIEELNSLANHLNDQERQAVECERDMARRLACLLLDCQKGTTKEGVISGVTDFGVFVEFNDMPAEGLIRMTNLGHEWLELDQVRQCLIGRETGAVWRLGQPVTVSIADVDLDRFEVHLVPALQHRGKSRLLQLKKSRKPLTAKKRRVKS